MAAPAMTPTVRYFRPGTTVILWVPTIADKTAVTRLEIDAGTDLSAEVFQINGFQVMTAAVETPDYGSRFTSSISGAITAPDSSLVTYADITSVDIRTVVQRDDNGFVVIMDEGDVSTLLMDVFPVRVGSVGKLRAREDPGRHQTDFFITSEPSENQAIPA